jgi:SAM-dependent methyltransferase
MTVSEADIPIPPVGLRRTVGVEGPEFFENPHRALVFGDAVEPESYRSVFDFGCGCGRIARQMMLQRHHIPEKYLGIDLYKPSIDWCSRNLTPINRNFRFHHHNFFNAGLNPGGSRKPIAIREQNKFSLVNAHSVFTHIIEDHAKFYFEQVANLVEENGCMRVSWFLFDKTLFPMMQTFQNALYINTDDATNAVIYDREFVKSLYRAAGLSISKIIPPGIRGHQWLIYACRAVISSEPLFPEDSAPIGLTRPPVRIGSD